MKKSMQLKFVLFAIIVLAGVLGFGCASADTYGDYTYTVSNGEATITGYYGSGVVSIPATMGGYPVTAIGNYAFSGSNTDATSVTIPEGVTRIEDSAFAECASLENISMPGSLYEIGSCAFEGCTGLTNIYIPENVASIGLRAFAGCTSLEWISVSSKNMTYASHGGVLYSNDMADLLVFPAGIEGSYTVPEGVANINGYAFYCVMGTNLKLDELILPESLTTIDYYAFQNCGLTSLTIPDNVTYIGICAFYDCDTLTSVDLPEGITEIYSETFFGCSNLTEIEIPEGVTSIAGSAFKNCSSLTGINLPKNLTYIGTDAFKGVSADFEAKVYFDSYALTYCKNNSIPYEIVDAFVVEEGVLVEYRDERANVVIPGDLGIVTIGASVFKNDYTITSVSIPEGVTTIEYAAFDGCYNLKDISLPSTLTTLQASCFYDCGMESLVLPAGVTAIPDHTFHSCNNLKSINLDNSTSIGRFAFQTTGIENLVLPEGLTELADNAFYSCSSLKSVVIPESLTYVPEWCFSSCGNLSSVTLHEKVTSIGNYAFAYCSKLSSISIPYSVTSIGADAFSSCGTGFTIFCHEDSAAAAFAGEKGYAVETESHSFVSGLCRCGAVGLIASGSCGENVNWKLDGNGVLTIYGEGPMEDYVYENTPWYSYRDSITAGVIEDGVTSVGETAFANCGKMTSIDIADSVTAINESAFHGCIALKEVVIPSGVTAIGDQAFFTNYVLEKVTLPDGLTYIGINAFYKCYQLKEIVLPDTVTTIRGYAFYKCINMTSINLPASITAFGDQYVFSGCEKLTASVYQDSVAHSYCVDNKIPYVLIGSTAEPTVEPTPAPTVEPTPEPTAMPTPGPTATSEPDKECAHENIETYGPYHSNSAVEEGYEFTEITDYNHVYVTDIIVTERYCVDCDTWLDPIVEEEYVVHRQPHGWAALDHDYLECEICHHPLACDHDAPVNYEYYTSEEEAYTYGNITETTHDITGKLFVDSICSRCTAWLGSEEITGTATMAHRYDENSVCYGCGYRRTCTHANMVPQEQVDTSTMWGYANYSDITETTHTCTNVVLVVEDCPDCDYYASDIKEPRTEAPVVQEHTFDENNVCTGCSYKRMVSDPTAEPTAEPTAAPTAEPTAEPTVEPTATPGPNDVIDQGTWGAEMDIDWKLYGNGLLKIYGNGPMRDGVPTWSDHRDEIRTVVISPGVTYIGDDAFSRCPNLTEITIPDSVTSFGDSVFYGCSSLTDITIPAGVTTIGGGAFYGCSSLTDITIPSGVTSIGGSTFSGCTGLTDIVIHAGVTEIGEYAFANCSGLTEITIPGNVSVIGDNAFLGCSGLEEITVANGVTSIGASAFEKCTGLTTVVIPDSVTMIGKFAFYDCSGLTEITLPAGMTEIGYGVFYNCGSLKNITIPGSVTIIGDYAFYNCSSLTDVILPYGVTGIGSYAFGNCTGLTSIYIPDSVTTIGGSAFFGSTKLTSITVPASVTTIGSYAFQGCKGRVVRVYENSAAHTYCINDSVAYELIDPQSTPAPTPTPVPTATPTPAPTPTVTPTPVPTVTPTPAPGDTVVYGSCGEDVLWKLDNEGTLTVFGEGPMKDYYYASAGKASTAPWADYVSDIKRVVVEPGVTTIGKYSFSRCTSLISATIPDGVTAIGGLAFINCSSLESVTIGDSVTSIGSSCFNGCSSALRVYCNSESATAASLSAGNVYYTDPRLPDYKLSKIGSDEEGYSITIYSYVGTDTSVEIPASICGMPVTAIGKDAFSGCTGLENVTIPDYVTSVSFDFAKCSNLKNIFCNSGTAAATIITTNETCYTDPLWPDFRLKQTGNETDGYSISVYKYAGEGGDVEIPASMNGVPVAEICSDAFSNCAGLTSVDIQGVGMSIGSSAFNNCINLTSVTIGDGVKSISYHVFSGCSNLTSVTIGNGVESIGGSAFSGCSNLVSVTIGDGLTSIADYAFLDCISLKEITIPGGVNEIGIDVFSGCTGLESAVIKPGVTILGTRMFENCTSLTSVTLPEGLTHIGYQTFMNCTGLTELEIPKSATTIGYGAFSGCSALKSIVLPAGTTAIAPRVFENCTALESVVIPDGVVTIGYDKSYADIGWNNYLGYSFYNCSSLRSISLPDSVTYLGYCTFSGCTNLSSVRMSANLTDLESYVFENCSADMKIYCDAGTVGAGHFSSFIDSECPDFSFKQKMDESGEYSLAVMTYTGSDTDVMIPAAVRGVPVTAMNSSLFRFHTGLNSISLPDEITYIGSDAFPQSGDCIIYCKAGTSSAAALYGKNFIDPSEKAMLIKQLSDNNGVYGIELVKYLDTQVSHQQLPDSLNSVPLYSIGTSAFADCAALTEISIPYSVKLIGSSAFENLSSLKTVSMEYGVTDIGGYAFENCSALENVNIPGSVTNIGSYAFINCSSLKQLTIPGDGVSVGYRAFNNCSGLTHLIIEGDGIELGSYVFQDCSSLKHISFRGDNPSIGSYVFMQCNALKHVSFMGEGATIGEGAFRWSQDDELYLAFMGNSAPVVHENGAFYTMADITVYCYEYSDVEYWAADEGYMVIYFDYDAEKPIEQIILPEDRRAQVGSSFAIEHDVFPMFSSPALAWESSDDTVVSVSETGEASILASGVATITCSDANGEAMDSMVITAFVGAESFELTESEVWIVAKKTLQLSVENLAPENADAILTWSSSDELGAVVDENGLVTTKGIKDVIITAEFENGVSRSCVLHVCAPVKSVAFDPKTVEAPVNEATLLTANVTTTRAQNLVNKLVTFESSDPDIASVDENGYVTGHLWGTAIITATSEEGISDICEVVVTHAEHELIIDEAVVPTCTETGLTEGKHCSVCGEVLVAQEVVPALGHDISFAQAVYETAAGGEAIRVSAAVTCGHDNDIIFCVPEILETVEMTDDAIVLACNEPCAVTVTCETGDGSGSIAGCTVIVHAAEQLVLPELLTDIDEEAFTGLPVREVVLSDNVKSIGKKAFAGCRELVMINLPDGVVIGEDAFSGCDQLTIICSEGSTAQEYAELHEIPYVIR